MKINGLLNNRKILAIVVIIPIVLIFSFIFYLIQGSYAKPSYSFSGNNLVISGQFGVKINLSGATVTHELSQVPATPIHTNGAAIGNIEKGYFKLGSLVVYKNVMDKNASDYIHITDNKGSEYYFNSASPEETNHIFNEISKHNESAE